MLKSIWYVYFWVIFVPDAESKQLLALAGPFKVRIRKIESCLDQITYKDTWTYYIQDTRLRGGEVVRFTGNHSLPFDLEDSSMGRIKMASWNSALGRWRENAHTLGCKNICRCLEFVAPAQWEHYQEIIFGEKTICPHLAGIYRFENMTVSMTNFAIKQFVYGRWRGDAHLLLKTGEIAGCIRVFADVVPL